MKLASKKLSEQCLAKAYIHAKMSVLSAGYADEVAWQRTVSLASLTESDLLRETAWVILSAGMRESIVRRKFPEISSSFFEWESARKIAESANACCLSALRHFNHSGKIRAIAEVAQQISSEGFQSVRLNIAADPINSLRQFPYIGPVTAFHLAKNIGISVAKADRHLSRLALGAGYDDVHAFCRSISEFVGDNVEVVDIVLWRFATLSKTYLPEFLASAHSSGITSDDDHFLE
ncbi:MAG: hypothetical protein LAN62_07825 [Acidobacteriia bacterium]|nr:hypothetical protein [Terriglobia bacterium]